MEEKLQEIIDKATEENIRVEEKITKLRSKVDFCSQHKFEEEKRIALVELNAIEMFAYRQGNIIKELQEVLNAWNS